MTCTGKKARKDRTEFQRIIASLSPDKRRLALEYLELLEQHANQAKAGVAVGPIPTIADMLARAP